MCESAMWSAVEKYFRRTPERLKVARALLELGLCIKEDKKIYCGPIEVSSIKMARALGIDRRVIGKTIRQILSETDLREVFTKVRPAGPLFRDVAKKFGFGVIVITADPKTVGIVASATTLIAHEGISIRQILAEDPELFPEPKLTIITEKEVPGHIIPKLLRIVGVKGVHVY